MATIVPFAQWRPLPEAETQPRITPRTVIFHTAVGGLRGTERFFKDSTGIESHMMVGGPWDGPELDGVIWQWMDLDRRADANLDANDFAISIESSDNAPSSAADLAPWSTKQLASLIRVGDWLADRYAIPRRQCRTWMDGGFGWHAMWGAPSHWTPVPGKVCPGAARIAQLKAVVFPAIFATNPEEDDLPYSRDEIKAMVREVLNEGTGVGQTSWAATSKATLRVSQDTYNEAAEANLKTKAVAARVEAIEGDVDLLVERTTPPPDPPV